MFALRWYLIPLAVAAILALTLARPSNGASGEVRYVVRPGDTLWQLAVERFGGDPREGVWRIRERNDLPSAVLQPGTVLLLPAQGGEA